MTTQELLKKDAAYVWHPFTQMAEWVNAEQIIIERGEGNWLIDTDGNRYLDGVSSLWTNVHGHQKKELNDAIMKQLDKVAHTTMLGLSSVPAIELAERLVEIAPEGLTRVFYSDSGSTAVEVAIKIAFQYQLQSTNGDPKRCKFISLKNAYHGDTVGSVAIGGMDLFHATYKALLFDSIKADSPYCYRCPFGQEAYTCNKQCFTQVSNLLEQHGHELAAFVIEPLLQGAAGQITHPEGYLAHVRKECTKHGVLLVADEVAVGFGKTGTMFACEQENVQPDIMCLAKGISGGYLPLAATMTTEAVYEAFLGRYEDFKTFFHGHTYTGNPLACAAAIASLDLFSKERVMEKVQRNITLLTELLEPLRSHPNVGQVRQCGLMTGIELVADKTTKEPFPIAERKAHKAILAARELGVIIRPLGDVIVLMPPLSITEDELRLLCEATLYGVNKATQGN